MDYQKPPLSIECQIQKLKERGLILGDESRAASYLSNIGFYRLSAYFIPFEDKANNQIEHAFQKDTHFNEVLKLYIFDRKLRLLVMEALERIEVAVRALWTNALAAETQQSHAYMQQECFKVPLTHLKQLNKVANDLDVSNELFVQHYRKKYRQPFLPPTWAMTETLSFGALSHWYSNTKSNAVKKQVSDAMSMPTVEIMDSVLDALTLIRNTSAHHARLWNRQLTKRMPYIKKLKAVLKTYQVVDKHGKAQLQMDNHLYNYLVIITYMMKSIQPSTSWPARLVEHILALTVQQQQAMGFPVNWIESLFWKDFSASK